MHSVDLIMVGCGPSNLAVSVAIEEKKKHSNIKSSIILEKDSSVCWHRGMLFPEAQSQVSFLKDLVTQRDPTSKFSFLNFLHKTQRLDQFINLQTFNPFRKEISNYLQWVADNLKKTQVVYDFKVIDISPEIDNFGKITGWHITSEKGEEYRAKKIIYGGGRDLNIPEVFANLSNEKVIHSVNYLSAVNQTDKQKIRNIAVVGGAQSSAEIYQSCLEQFPEAKVSMIMRSIGLVNYEGSQFTNTLFQNDYINTHFEKDDNIKAGVLKAMRTTNYAGVAPATLSGLYKFHYLQEMNGVKRAVMHTQCEIINAIEKANGIAITWKDNISDKVCSETFDMVFLGTGFKNKTPALFKKLQNVLQIEKIKVTRKYRAILPCVEGVSLHLQGVNEETHGIADSLLSVLALRSREIVDDILVNNEVENALI